MNRNPMWKNVLVIAVIFLGGFFAMPNLYDKDAAVQVSAGRYGKVDLALVSKVESALKAQSVAYIGAELQGDRLLVRLADSTTQLKAKKILDETIKGDYTIALNLASTTPSWLSGMGAEAMNLGLDLRGGVHFLMDVDMDAAIKKTLEGLASEFRGLLRDEKIRYKRIQTEADQVIIGFRNSEHRDMALAKISSEYNELVVEAQNIGTAPSLVIRLTEVTIRETKTTALQQNIITLRNRINELGVAEPTVQQQGDSRIVVQLPGVQDTAQAKKILGGTATLEFRLVDFEHDVQDAVKGRVPATSKIYYHRDGRPYLLQKRVMLTGDHIINSGSTLDSETGTPTVSVTLDGKGARIFSKVTGDNIGNPMAVVLIESKTEVRKNY
jgi:preprotein translocase subunit SecD